MPNREGALMARTRQIKPAFFKNELLAECNVFARLLFIGMWTLADKEGRLEDRPMRIKAEVFPYDNIDVKDLLSSLSEKGFIKRYEILGQSVIQILNFVKHQHIHNKEQDSELPEYKEEYKLQEKPPTSTVQQPNLPPLTTLNPIPNYPTSELPKPDQQEKLTLPDWLPKKEWSDYCKHRGKKLTDQAKTLQLTKLGKWVKQGHDPIEIINESIMNGWQGLFEPKGNKNGKPISELRGHAAAAELGKAARRIIEQNKLQGQSTDATAFYNVERIGMFADSD